MYSSHLHIGAFWNQIEAFLGIPGSVKIEKQMKSETDWFGKWYELQEENGETTHIGFAQVFGENKEPEWISVSHVKNDGIGAFCGILRENGHSVTPPKSSYARQVWCPFQGLSSHYRN